MLWLRARGGGSAALLLVLVLGSMVAVAQEGAAPPDQLVPPGYDPDLLLLYSGDVIGYLEDCGCKKNPAGGLARRAWVAHEVRKKFPGVPLLVVDSGNFSDQFTPEGDLKTAALVEAMGRLGYAAANVGEREIRMGYDDLLRRTSGARFPLLSANILRQRSQEPAFTPYVVIEVASPDGTAKRRVGISGVVRYNPVLLKAGPEGDNLIIAHPLEPLRHAVRRMEQEGARTIVVLAALPKEDAARLAADVPRIDFIVGSYGGFFTQEPEQLGSTWLLYSGNQGKRFGETRVVLDEGGRCSRQATNLHFLTRLYPSDPEMLEFVETEMDRARAPM
jgi:2',3'-cyclic-nucleotide 2'-phosphodiesterase (5'-nucleotidase family)